MTHTKKRILAMLLAVVLMFGTLPFSVSADEVSSELPTESTVESQPEESQAEDSTPSDGETAESSPSENHHHLGQLRGRACSLRHRPL